MSQKAEAVSVNISTEEGTVKRPVPEVRLDERGIIGDAHAGPWHRQVSLLSQDNIDRFAATMNLQIAPGELAENITLRGIDLNCVAVLDRFRIGGVELEVSQIGKDRPDETHPMHRQPGISIMLEQGIFCRVVHGGTIRPGNRVEYLPRPLQFWIITLSDRAFARDYTDRSGPRIRELLEAFLEGTRWHAEIRTTLLPDDAENLRAELANARDAGADVIFTTGSTGVGPRDIAPETVTSMCDKLIPGIMEAIRIKFGAQNPNALLTRGVAGACGQTLIYTLPGSVRAVDEYLGEILLTMEHLILMLHGLDIH
ncbi:MAG: molybdenum cofactor synthesis protein [Armatimonadetes bacterium]|nr:molybdenum cofactor synthesis protein [Armatimonadota bacterium]